MVGIAIGIFLMLMSTEMPNSNRELLIAFVSVLFGAMSSSLKNITGDESTMIQDLQRKNTELAEKIKELSEKE